MLKASASSSNIQIDAFHVFLETIAKGVPIYNMTNCFSLVMTSNKIQLRPCSARNLPDTSCSSFFVVMHYSLNAL